MRRSPESLCIKYDKDIKKNNFNLPTRTNAKEREEGTMREQLASQRGITEQRRIRWREKPEATDESLYKQPVKPCAQVGTIPLQTISSCSTGLPGAAAQAKLICGF